MSIVSSNKFVYKIYNLEFYVIAFDVEYIYGFVMLEGL